LPSCPTGVGREIQRLPRDSVFRAVLPLLRAPEHSPLTTRGQPAVSEAGQSVLFHTDLTYRSSKNTNGVLSFLAFLTGQSWGQSCSKSQGSRMQAASSPQRFRCEMTPPRPPTTRLASRTICCCVTHPTTCKQTDGEEGTTTCPILEPRPSTTNPSHCVAVSLTQRPASRPTGRRAQQLAQDKR
jgi:hypothetical protein